jgi:hypothetical protein
MGRFSGKCKKNGQLIFTTLLPGECPRRYGMGGARGLRGQVTGNGVNPLYA